MQHVINWVAYDINWLLYNILVAKPAREGRVQVPRLTPRRQARNPAGYLLPVARRRRRRRGDGGDGFLSDSDAAGPGLKASRSR